MGKGKRLRSEKKIFRERWGIEDLQVDRQTRRKLEQLLTGVESLAELRSDIAAFDRVELVSMLPTASDLADCLAVGRVVREAARTTGRGSKLPRPIDVRKLLGRSLNVMDGDLVKLIANGTLHEQLVGRILVDQFPLQRDIWQDIPRSAAIFIDDSEDSPLNSSAWSSLLGLDLAMFLMGVAVLSASLQHGPISESELFKTTSDQYLKPAVESVLADVGGTIDELFSRETRVGIDLYDLGPLVSQPVICHPDGRLFAPSSAHLGLAVSPPALYIRQVRAESGNSRIRSQAIADRFERYVERYTRAALPPAWTVVAIDEEGSDIRRADLAIWPADRSLLLLVELKTTLSSVAATLGDEAKQTRMRELFVKAFDQVGKTKEAIGPSFLSAAPDEAPVYGLCVTLDVHFTSIVDGATHLGLMMDYRSPTKSGIKDDSVSCRVIPSMEYERLVDFMGLASSTVARQLLDDVFGEPSPVSAVSKYTSEHVASNPTLAGLDEINPVIKDSLTTLFRALPEEVREKLPAPTW